MVLRVFVWVLAVVAGVYVADEAVWLVRGAPVPSVGVSVVTAMELKGGKEDYGDPEMQQVACESRMLPGPSTGGMLPPCWWVERHTQVVRRP